MKTIKIILKINALSLFIPLLASAPADHIPEVAVSYISNANALSPEKRQELIRLKQCNTFEGTPKESSKFYRELCYEALSAMKHPYPELIMLTNEQSCSDPIPESSFGPKPFTGKEAFSGPCMINKEKGRGIQFDESYWQDQDYGAQRLVMYHEAWHIKNHDYYKKEKDYAKMQQKELTADYNAVNFGNCTECTRQFSQWLLDFNELNEKEEDRYTLEKLDKMTLDQITSKIDELKILSLKAESIHPLDTERAFRIYSDTRIPIESLKENPLCPYHQRIAQRAQNAKIAQAEFARQKMQQQMAIKQQEIAMRQQKIEMLQQKLKNSKISEVLEEPSSSSSAAAAAATSDSDSTEK